MNIMKNNILEKDISESCTIYYFSTYFHNLFLYFRCLFSSAKIWIFYFLLSNFSCLYQQCDCYLSRSIHQHMLCSKLPCVWVRSLCVLGPQLVMGRPRKPSPAWTLRRLHRANHLPDHHLRATARRHWQKSAIHYCPSQILVAATAALPAACPASQVLQDQPPLALGLYLALVLFRITVSIKSLTHYGRHLLN